MGIFDNLFKNKEEVVAPVVNKDVNIYDEIKTLIKENKEVNQLHMTKLIHNDRIRGIRFNDDLFENKLAGVDKAIKIKENKEDIINFVLKIPLEYRPFKERYDYESDINKRFERAMNNEFLVINDITEAQKVKLDSMLDGFKNKLGTEWLLGFVDFMKEIDNMNLHQRTIEDKTFSKLEGNFVFKSEQPIIRAYKILEDATKLYISGTQLNATIEDKFNKGDYIIEDNFGKFINVSKEDFEAKYKVIEKKSLDNIKDPSYSFDDAKNINISKEDFEAKYKVIEKESIEKESFDNIIDETKKVLTDKSNEYNGLKKELESAKVEIERLREKLNGIENNFKSLS